ncbi:hypothetical protein GF415_03295 [Candidatus Micrarchaeota archaeon]|nr:hypothetical protein [Candidatus Micrarchaeota archaeon]
MLELSKASKLICDAFKERDQRKMRRANDTIMTLSASRFSKEMYELAVYSYVLSKVLSKPRFMSKKYSATHKEIQAILNSMVRDAKKRDKKAFRVAVKGLRTSIQTLESRDSRYIKTMIEKGRLKTAATLYAQGLSLSTASKLTGVESQEIMDYAGKTRMFDRVTGGKSLASRIDYARKMLLGGV